MAGLSLLALVGALVAGVAHDHGVGISTLTSRALPALRNTAIAAGFGLDQVTLSGHRIASDHDIFDALELGSTPTIFSFDSAAARARIEKLSWVARAEIVRVYPGQLAVRIEERRPFAVWRNGDERFLIDREGHVLSPIAADFAPNLAQVSGAGAAQQAANLFQLLSQHPQLRIRLQNARFVAGRRWTLQLDDGVVMHLPADGGALALQKLSVGGGLQTLIARGSRIIDLRSPGQVAVRAVSG